MTQPPRPAHPLNVTVFLWYGAYLPWSGFAHSVPGLAAWRLVVLGVLVLLRRLPWVFGMHKWIHKIRQVRQAVFVGFFGPIGVSAIFYLFVSLQFIEEHLSDDKGVPRSDVKDLGETIRVVVWFLAVCSIVIHRLSLPLGKVGYLAPRRLSRALSESLTDEPQRAGGVEEDPHPRRLSRPRQGRRRLDRRGGHPASRGSAGRRRGPLGRGHVGDGGAARPGNAVPPMTKRGQANAWQL